jgi:hypothetical protein
MYLLTRSAASMAPDLGISQVLSLIRFNPDSPDPHIYQALLWEEKAGMEPGKKEESLAQAQKSRDQYQRLRQKLSNRENQSAPLDLITQPATDHPPVKTGNASEVQEDTIDDEPFFLIPPPPPPPLKKK